MSLDTRVDVFFALAQAGGWLIDALPALAAVGITAAAWKITRRHAARQALRRTPAAPDNQRGTNVGLLWECRRIHAEPLADADNTRRLINYLRDNAGEEKP
ncbi:hypothetical protein [Streptomyces iakyrus]|uniref:hypothetical protein n=1 Tax=Streptomyces iakyrus TaxID=68219 RepID=UPI0036C599EA